MKILFAVFVLVFGVALHVKPVLAQPAYKLQKTDPRKYSPHASSMYTRHARDNARMLYHYGRTRESVPNETAQQHVTGVRQNLAASKTELAKLKAEKPLDENVQKLVRSIEGHYSKCEEMCKMMDMPGTESSDMAKMCDHCAMMSHELDAALEDHDKLMKMLGTEKLEEPMTEAAK